MAPDGVYLIELVLNSAVFSSGRQLLARLGACNNTTSYRVWLSGAALANPGPPAGPFG